MNKKILFDDVDKLINKINNIPIEQFKKCGLERVQVARKDKFLFILGTFDVYFNAQLSNFITDNGELFFNIIDFPNRLFFGHALLVFDLSKMKYLTHRFYPFPIYYDMYDVPYNDGKDFDPINDDIINDPYSIDTKMLINVDSDNYFILPKYDETCSAEVEIKSILSFEIDEFMKKVQINNGSRVLIYDNIHTPLPVPEEVILREFECTCVDEIPECVEYFDSDNYDNYEFKDCKCGKYDVSINNYRCFKCFLEFEYIKDGYYYNPTDDYIVYSIKHTMPLVHYNNDYRGICIGDGYEFMNKRVIKVLNPIVLMMEFKANLSYTDNGTSNLYYRMYKQKISVDEFYIYSNYHMYLEYIFVKDSDVNIKLKRHIFSMMCYCYDCFSYRIMLRELEIKLDPRGFDVNQPALITRDQFINVYKRYLKINRKNKDYFNGDIHKKIKEVVNLKISDFVK